MKAERGGMSAKDFVQVAVLPLPTRSVLGLIPYAIYRHVNVP